MLSSVECSRHNVHHSILRCVHRSLDVMITANCVCYCYVIGTIRKCVCYDLLIERKYNWHLNEGEPQYI